MLELSDAVIPLLVHALRDAVRYNEQLLQSETLRNRDEYEEYLVEVSQLYAEVKTLYKKFEADVGNFIEDIW
ncbi:hypothetical protein [Teredinibacter sp. KSP-S5-2]|uniref:hypothetical protein n=1 Tax=Teredinibacter sp. KSP-S5-2 TaxID=3034506 RepID=UPI002934C194|nr:hypothetical protein [Teredinibacter sp. KSP-S5-2]WNO07802.1 hypothetical protein P5V12_12460 [Teredinibacter sp. KSP-S5-2]